MPHDFDAWRPLCSAIAATFLASGTVAAQSTVAGTWTAYYDRRVPGIHVGVAKEEPREARLTLQIRGDSVFGRWQMIALGKDESPPVREVRGTLRSDSVLAIIEPVVGTDEGVVSAMVRTVSDSLRSWFHDVPPMITTISVEVRRDSLIGMLRSQSRDGRTVERSTPLVALRVR